MFKNNKGYTTSHVTLIWIVALVFALFSPVGNIKAYADGAGSDQLNAKPFQTEQGILSDDILEAGYTW